MGALSSKKRHQNWSWTGPPGDHSPFPLDPFPYPGSDVLYCFVDIMASYQIMRNRLNLGPQAVTTDIEEYLTEITDCYEEGFSLNDFVKVPGVKTTTEIQDWGTKHPYQAILSKPTTERKVTGGPEKWMLQIEKRILSTKTLAFDETDVENDLLTTIQSYAAVGGRLVCAEPVGFVRSDSCNTQYGIIGVELFFNVPLHKNPTLFTYYTVQVPANYNIVPDATQTIQHISCDADFMGQMKAFLAKGWKLVDICIDTTAIAEAYRMRSTSKRVDTIWIFEKEASLLHDDTPKYEGVIIEYLHKVKMTLDGEVPCKDWRPVIAGMGVSGWELAAIIQTPLLVQSSFTTYTMKLLMVFQRKIHPSLEQLKKMKMSSSVPNTPGEKRAKSKDAGKEGGVFGTRRSSAGNAEAYYHHTLKRYIYGDEPIGNGPVLNGYVPVQKEDSAAHLQTKQQNSKTKNPRSSPPSYARVIDAYKAPTS